MDGIKIGLIGGSGMAQALDGGTEIARHVVDTPFGPPSGPIREADWNGVNVLLLSRHGAGHVLNPSAVPYRANIHALKQLGCTHILATGAVGSLRQEIAPRQLVIADSVIDKTFRRAATFYDRAAVHVEMADPFCPALRKLVIDASKATGIKVHEKGTYICMEGPAFSTRAESLMHRLWGGDVIGMTAMPEARLAREAEIAYCLVALATDYDAWKPKPTPKEGESPVAPQALLEEIRGHLTAATENATAVIRKALESVAANAAALRASPALSALDLAIWSDKSAIPAEEVRRLDVLWGRHFK